MVDVAMTHVLDPRFMDDKCLVIGFRQNLCTQNEPKNGNSKPFLHRELFWDFALR